MVPVTDRKRRRTLVAGGVIVVAQVALLIVGARLGKTPQPPSQEALVSAAQALIDDAPATTQARTLVVGGQTMTVTTGVVADAAGALLDGIVARCRKGDGKTPTFALRGGDDGRGFASCADASGASRGTPAGRSELTYAERRGRATHFVTLASDRLDGQASLGSGRSMAGRVPSPPDAERALDAFEAGAPYAIDVFTGGTLVPEESARQHRLALERAGFEVRRRTPAERGGAPVSDDRVVYSIHRDDLTALVVAFRASDGSTTTAMALSEGGPLAGVAHLLEGGKR